MARWKALAAVSLIPAAEHEEALTNALETLYYVSATLDQTDGPYPLGETALLEAIAELKEELKAAHEELEGAEALARQRKLASKKAPQAKRIALLEMVNRSLTAERDEARAERDEARAEIAKTKDVVAEILARRDSA